MSDYGWAVMLLMGVFGAYATVIYRIHAKQGSINTRVAILEDKDLEAQMKELTREVNLFRTEIRDASEKNFATLWEKMDALRLEIKADLKAR